MRGYRLIRSIATFGLISGGLWRISITQGTHDGTQLSRCASAWWSPSPSVAWRWSSDRSVLVVSYARACSAASLAQCVMGPDES